MLAKKEGVLYLFVKQLYSELKDKIKQKQTTFGFEIEYLPSNIIDITHMDKLYQLMPKLGFRYDCCNFVSDSGLSVAFEPGGQIEYCSPPLYGSDYSLFRKLLKHIETTNEKIFHALNIKYLATDFIPGRANAPLCLQTKRYIALHNRLSRTGTRGKEMMKGTASIHLHVAFRCMDELLPIYKLLDGLSKSKQFSMSKHRRNIWNNTDPSRCVMPSIKFNSVKTTEDLLEHLVHHALCAEDLYENIPVYKLKELDFNYFKAHMTTIFTDVRLNLKGPTMELRTLDSMPACDIKKKWRFFTSVFDNDLN